MAEKMTRFVWRHSARDQLVLLFFTLLTFPIIWITLELPKTIINEAISGTDFPKEFLGIPLEQTEYLIALCFAYLLAISINNGVKYAQNVQRGILGERMLRRMRFDLYRRVMGRPLSRLKNTSPGELVQMISAELAPIGDFVGAIISTPVSQGGSFLVYLSFIIVQNPLIGAAALCLYPVQAWLVPKLQAKVIAMIRVRLANIRAMAREIDESIDGATEIRALRARRWHQAVVSRQLYDNYVIRRRIFLLKNLIKFVNNVANHLTPFFIFLIGGWFVIHGELNVGALTAVLIAYKDLAAPWKELLRFYQDYSDMNARYTSVMENFSEDGDPAPLLDRAPVGPHALALSDAHVDGLPGQVSVHVPHASVVAVHGEDAVARSALLQALSGMVDSQMDSWSAGTPILYRSAAYVPSDPRVFAGSMRDNLVHGLLFRPVAPGDDDQHELRRREAAITGAPDDDISDEWIDPVEAGYDDLAAVEARIHELVAVLGLEDDLYAIGLLSRFNPEEAPELASRLVELRGAISASEELGEMREDFIDHWQVDRYNPNASVGENLFFALPVDPDVRWPDVAEDRAVLRALEEAGVRATMVEMGLDLCETLLSLFEGVAADSDLFKRYGLFPRSETATVEGILRIGRQRGADKLNRAAQAKMIAIAFSYCSARYRLGVMRGTERVEALLAARPKLMAFAEKDPRFAVFDAESFHPAFSMAENIFFGPVKLDRRDSWTPFKERVDALVGELGLRELILRAGMAQPLGEAGTTLNALQRRKMGLARALMKNPGALVLDGIAAGDAEADQALRALLRGRLGDGALVYGTERETAAQQADHVIRIDRQGRVTQEVGTGDAPPAVDGARDGGR
ncbi:ABC transporter transmembrane domain-containing protein [Albimonas sp. CAU 1670]|uniref:ABC transporter transmembrane domain-containing protein n=1 Tax=Albimonas sp. CAU 1670 TaxID=3032599 RepID=UPI0023DB50B4|nr:ABC transporter transmembrane domain-containing protein [Albimonas sp. CAU 1670]MDF2233315.1 ABC transporter transmembrane domain-containing protein [Albimonas sp. CAU 1670]